MIINTQQNEKHFTLCTANEFAHMIAQKVFSKKKPGETRFVADFTIVSTDYIDDVTIEELNDEGWRHGWYGIKELGNCGFDAEDNRQLLFDYYGGGAGRLVDIPQCYYSDSYYNVEEDIVSPILEAIGDVLSWSEPDLPLFVQWDPDTEYEGCSPACFDEWLDNEGAEDEDDVEYDVALGCNEDDYVLASDGNIKIKRSLVYESFCQVGEALRIWFVDEEDPLHTYRVVKITDDEVIAEFIK